MSSRKGALALVVFSALLGVAVLAAALLLRRPGAGARSGSVLVFDVPGTIEEAPPPARPLSLRAFRRERPTLFDLVDGLHRAAEDDHVEALVLHLDRLDWGWAQIGELRDAVRSFRAHGKPVYASLTGGGEREYLLASAAGRVSAPPTTVLQLDGLAASATFFRGSLDKLDIHPNFAQVGRYKSGTEPYTRTGHSAPGREQLEALLDDLYAVVCDSLATARGMSPDSIRSLIDGGPYLAPDARARGLLDTLVYVAEADSAAVRHAARGASTTTLARYLDRLVPPPVGAKVALVVAEGTIESGKSREAFGGEVVLGSETVIEALRQARTRRSIRAIVLRIDSPGGEAQAADDIWREVERCRRQKPVIVSFSDLAASGGYYIAVAGDSIVARPETITGSIGIYGGKLNILGLYHKLGLEVETLSRGRHAEMFSPYRDFTPEEAERFQRQLEGLYAVFLDRVARGRNRSTASVDSVGQGRVWSGDAGRRIGLVDALGGFDRAFAMARARAGIPADEPLVVERYPRVQRSFFERVLGDVFDDSDDSESDTRLPPVVAAWLEAARFPSGAALALLPFSVEIR